MMVNSRIFRPQPFGSSPGSLSIRGGRDLDKLFASKATNKILGPDILQQERSRFAQYRVTRIMAAGVIQLLENGPDRASGFPAIAPRAPSHDPAPLPVSTRNKARSRHREPTVCRTLRAALMLAIDNPTCPANIVLNESSEASICGASSVD
jgi:hypothetical protein